MARARVEKLPRGIFERDKGTGVFWIRYTDLKGKKRREKAGRMSDATSLLAKRKTELLQGRKLPETMRDKTQVLVSDLCDMVLEFTANHKSKSDYITRAAVFKAAIGDTPADELTPLDIDRMLKKHCKTPATYNRYKAFLGLAYREAMKNGKATSNPARMVTQRKEPEGRLRFLSRDEYKRLRAAVVKLYPQHLAEFEVSVHTGMRLSEQYTATWSQYDAKRRVIDLDNTKNGSSRTIFLNAVSVAAIESVQRPVRTRNSPIFHRDGTTYDNRSWFLPCVKEAGIAKITWHGNRHTFCSWLAMAGASLKEIQEMAGHKTIAMSARYAHLSPSHKSVVIERITVDPDESKGHQKTKRTPKRTPDANAA